MDSLLERPSSAMLLSIMYNHATGESGCENRLSRAVFAGPYRISLSAASSLPAGIWMIVLKIMLENFARRGIIKILQLTSVRTGMRKFLQDQGGREF